jgi:hypothetical protein
VITIAVAQRSPYLERPPSSSLVDVVDLILDKGLVIDAYVRVSLLGIEVLTIDARIVIASVDTYLRFAEAVNRLDLTQTQTHGLPELLEGAQRTGAREKTKGALDAAGEKVSELTHPERHAERRNRRGNGHGEDSS